MAASPSRAISMRGFGSMLAHALVWLAALASRSAQARPVGSSAHARTLRVGPASLRPPAASASRVALGCARAQAAARRMLGGVALGASIGLGSLAPDMCVPELLRAVPPALAAESPTEPRRVLGEAWDLADRYFLDRSFGGHDWKAVRAQYVDGTPAGASEEKVEDRLKEMYSLLGDRYSRALSPAEAAKLAKFDVTGVNVNVMKTEDGRLVVSAVPPADSESAKAGVRFGDRVLAINGVSMSGKTPFDALDVIQARTDGFVEMELAHPAAGAEQAAPAAPGVAATPPASADGEPYRVRLKRTFTVSSPVESALVRLGGSGPDGRGVGYVRLKEFNSVGKRQVAETLRELEGKGADAYARARAAEARALARQPHPHARAHHARALTRVRDARGSARAASRACRYVLDLRGNLGGVLEGAIGIAGYFTGKGTPVVDVVDGAGTKQRYSTSEERIIPAGKQLVLLVDGRSASASEVLAGALHDSCRATLVGERTFGKGVIQGVFGLSDGGAVILTLAEYRSPSGAVINTVGVQPDAAVPLVSNVFPPLLSLDLDKALSAASAAPRPAQCAAPTS